MQQNNLKNESGRSLLEMIAIIVVLIILVIGSIMLYRFAMASHEASVIHDDLMVRGRLGREGRPRQGKQFSVEMENKTRLGTDIVATEEDINGIYYAFSVDSIKMDVCAKILQKDFKGADRITINEETFAVNAAGNIVGSPECLQENFIKVTFSKNTGYQGGYIPRTCTTDKDCPRQGKQGARRCIRGICVDQCDECRAGQCCFQGTCVPCSSPGPTPCDSCPEGKCCDNGSCVSCPRPHPVPPDCPSSCCECNRDQDICSKCRQGFHLTEGGQCAQCPPYSICPPCSPDIDFECKENFILSENKESCYCPAGFLLDPVNETCTPCPVGTYSPTENSTSCTPCPCGTYTNSQGTITCDACADGYYATGTQNTSCTAATGRQYVLSDNKCEVKTADTCKKANSTHTNQENCTADEKNNPACAVPTHKIPDGNGNCICYAANKQGDCVAPLIEDGNCNCVQCVNNGNCGTTQCNLKNNTCCTPDKPYYDASAPKCIKCNGNYGSGTSRACPTAENPLCNNDVCTTCGDSLQFNTNTHTCCPDNKPYYDSNAQKCIACNGNYGSGATRACPTTSNPVCSNDVCTTCDSGIEFNTSTHTCCPNDKPYYDANAKKCIACNGNYGSGASRACQAITNPICSNDNVCTACGSGYCYNGSSCINMSSYDDLNRASNGTCVKKTLNITYTFPLVEHSISSNSQSYGYVGDVAGIVVVTSTATGSLKLYYSHTATLNISVDDCVYGSFVGVSNCATCKANMWTCYNNNGHSKSSCMCPYSGSVTIGPGTYNSIYIKGADIWKTATRISGTARITN